jgi:phage terminase large subunit-like protein
MSPALKALEAALLGRKIRHGSHPILTMCASNARVAMDEAGNRKLVKAKSTGRIDGMIALVQAIGGAEAAAESEEAPYYATLDPETGEPRGLLILRL